MHMCSYSLFMFIVHSLLVFKLMMSKSNMTIVSYSEWVMLNYITEVDNKRK